MRLTVDLSDELMQKAMWACRIDDPAEVLTLALETLVSAKLPERLLARAETYYADSVQECSTEAGDEPDERQ